LENFSLPRVVDTRNQSGIGSAFIRLKGISATLMLSGYKKLLKPLLKSVNEKSFVVRKQITINLKWFL